MTLRPLLFLGLLAFVPPVRAQECIPVVRDDERRTTGLLITCTNGTLLGQVDALGQVCLAQACDTLVVSGRGMAPMRIALTDVRAQGRLLIKAEARELSSVDITPWPAPRDRRALAATSTPDSTALRGMEGSGLRDALLWIPGVQMDERGHGGSTRLSIRGSLLRAPYGVRGVKVYWGPFALTLADGSTPLELLDPELVGSMDVVRSVGGPAYGAAPSGLLLAEPPWRRTPGVTVQASATGGAYGYFKLAGAAQLRQEDGSALSVGVLRMGNDGYRQQEYSRRDQVFLTGQWRVKRSLTRLFVTGQHAVWGLPGSIDSTLAAQDPRAARPYSQSIDARVDKTQLFAGLGNETALTRTLHLLSAVQLQSINKLNPYGTTPALSGYKQEHIQAAGARLALGGELEGARLAFAWSAGLELLLDRDDLEEDTYAYGIIGGPRTDAVARVDNLDGFITTRTHIGERTTVFADVGVERTAFHLEDELRNTTVENGRPGVLYPLFGLERSLGNALTVHVRYAESRSRPTIWEMLGSTGVFNEALVPEDVRESEAGLLWRWKAVELSLNGYLRRTDGLILERTVANGTVDEFYNAGDAEQNGIEGTAHLHQAFQDGHRLDLQLGGAWQDHHLRTPEREGAIDVPGVPRWTSSALARWGMRWGTTLEVGVRTVSALSASVLNDDRLPGYAVLHLRVDQALSIHRDVLDLFAYVENVGDVRYTSFVQLSDPGRRYYNPAPGRSVFVGAAFRFARAVEQAPR